MTVVARAQKSHTPMVEHVLRERYLNKGETYPTMLERVARHVASAEDDTTARDHWYARFRDLLLSNRFLPNSPCLMNAGNDLGQLSACFVLPVGDSVEEIFRALGEMAKVQASGGGTGFSFSRLRSKGAPIRSTGKTSPGPIPFLHLFNSVEPVIQQSAKRRGANMAILDVTHPDIEEFIWIKTDPLDRHLRSTIGERRWREIWGMMSEAQQTDYRRRMQAMTGFNISVAVTDEFMRAVVEDSDYWQVDPTFPEIRRKRSARAVFAQLVACAHMTGDPGLFFPDRANRDNPLAHIGSYEATNPCAEQPLLNHESCVLGSINLSEFVSDDPSPVFDWSGFRRTVRQCVRFLDNVNNVNRYPLDSIADMARVSRRVGLGVMGLADLFLALGIDYRSEQAVGLSSSLSYALRREAFQASEDLAEERGRFEAWQSDNGHRPRRNSVVTTVAPTGSISMLAGCSSGIEPVFSFVYERKTVGKTFLEYHPLARPLINGGGRADLPPHFVEAHDVPPEAHLAHQAAWQEHIDSAISKTINLPTTATEEDVWSIYVRAWKAGCKGITVFRDGCRDEQVLSVGEDCGACGATVVMIHQEGCRECPECGVSACSL